MNGPLIPLLLLAAAGALRPGQPLPLENIADIPLPGGATRMDYIAIDSAAHRVWLAHMGDGTVVAVDVAGRKVLAEIPGLPRVRGVLAVPELNRVYAAAAGTSEIVVIDADKFTPMARIPAGNVDGLDYVPAQGRLFVTDQHGGNDVVIDTRTNQVIARIPVGGNVGNTRWDPSTGRVLVAVGESNELVAIDPASLNVTGRYPLSPLRGAHGIAVDPAQGMAYVAGEDNARLVAFDLRTNRVVADEEVGDGVDVIAVDTVTQRLYAASESGFFTVFDTGQRGLRRLAQGEYAPHAHVVGVDPATHLVYVPLENVDGHPVLRIARPQRRPG